MPNHLAHESSPYLRQHAGNPVDWYPWGPEALARAVSEQKPIFLSIGYSACHWCHVMEHESFENPRIAALLNEHFISIKVDREERPDLDHVYMLAVQALTGRGGWPMSVFLSPNLEPFFGGTYWPPEPRGGMHGFAQIVSAVAEAWRDRREVVRAQATRISDELRGLAGAASQPGELPGVEAIDAAAAALRRVFDRQHGGFGGSPKFPHPMDLQLLLRAWIRTLDEEKLHIVVHTLERMAAGGIYDQLGGGFHRYSVDERWLVPHFEKMLYDNALLAGVYVEAWQATGRGDLAQVARETLDHVLRDLSDAEGGFHSTIDADSEGEEGKYYVWTPAELRALLDEETAELFASAYDVSAAGNFEGHSILNRPRPLADLARERGIDPEALAARLAAARSALLAARGRRVPPGLDDKVIVAWNGLAIDALARAGAALGEPRYVAAAVRAAEFIERRLRRPDGRLWRVWHGGQARHEACLDDYSYLGQALVSLYEATFDERWIDAAAGLADVILDRFPDRAHGGFFFTADDHEPLYTRYKDVQDGSLPSGNGMAATFLIRLGKLTGEPRWLDAGVAALGSFAGLLERESSAAGQLLLALDFWLGPTYELAFTGPCREAVAEVQAQFLPRRVLAWRREDAATGSRLDRLFAGRPCHDAPALYVCEGFACQSPVIGAAAISARLLRLDVPAT